MIIIKSLQCLAIKQNYRLLKATKVLKSENDKFAVPELHEMAKLQKFPLKVVRKGEAVNKIEQLIEFIHVKSITSKHLLLKHSFQ